MFPSEQEGNVKLFFSAFFGICFQLLSNSLQKFGQRNSDIRQILKNAHHFIEYQPHSHKSAEKAYLTHRRSHLFGGRNENIVYNYAAYHSEHIAQFFYYSFYPRAARKCPRNIRSYHAGGIIGAHGKDKYGKGQRKEQKIIHMYDQHHQQCNQFCGGNGGEHNAHDTIGILLLHSM